MSEGSFRNYIVSSPDLGVLTITEVDVVDNADEGVWFYRAGELVAFVSHAQLGWLVVEGQKT